MGCKLSLDQDSLAPLVILAGEGTELYRGVGVIVMFGLLGTAIALTVLVLRISKSD